MKEKVAAIRESSPDLSLWLRERFRFRRAERNWLEEETSYDPRLARLSAEVRHVADKKQLIDEIGELAETHYAALWSNCSLDEKLLLFQLAQNGLANGSNRRLIRRLIARGLVRRDPNLELFSETFRVYVLSRGREEEVQQYQRESAGLWSSVRTPMFVIIIAFLLFLFGTQKDVLTVSTTLLTAITSGIPLILKLVGTVTERRGETAERA